MNRLFAVLCLVIGASLPDMASAEEVPTGFGSVPWSAEQVIARAGAESVQKLYHSPGQLRIEGPTGLSFLDITNKRMWVKAPGQTGYMAFPFDPASVSGIGPGGTFTSTAVGEETIDGLKTIKYSFEMMSGEMTGKGFYWMTPDGIRVRQEGETKFTAAEPAVPFSIMLRNLQLGPQDPSLFKLPK